MAFPHLPPTRHCTQMHPLSLQLAVALLPPSLPLSPRGNGRAAFSRSAPRRGAARRAAPRPPRGGREGRLPAGRPRVGVRPAELRSARLRSAELRMPQLRRPELQRQLSRGDGITSVFSWPQSHTSPSCAAPSSGSSGSSGGISSFVLSLSSSRPVNITSCAPTLGAWGACLRKLSPHAAAMVVSDELPKAPSKESWKK